MTLIGVDVAKMDPTRKPDSKTPLEPARKFWVLNMIISTQTRNKSNLKNPKIFGSNPTRTRTRPFEPNIISLFLDF